MRKRKGWQGLLLAVFFVFATLSATVSGESISTIDFFRMALRNNDIKSFRSIIAPGGVTFVRLINPNETGRGTEVALRVTELPNTFQVAVPNDLPFDLRYLFGGTIRSKTLNYPDVKLDGVNYPEESVGSVRNFARKVIETVNRNSPSFVPTVARLGNRWFVLCEAESNQGMLSGALAIFDRDNGLKMVVDLR